MFLDEANIIVRGGNGGRGCVSWRRAKFEPMGGPDGGNGGKGGDVILQADENADTLSDYVSRKRFEAPKGRFGSGSNRNGKPETISPPRSSGNAGLRNHRRKDSGDRCGFIGARRSDRDRTGRTRRIRECALHILGASEPRLRGARGTR